MSLFDDIQTLEGRIQKEFKKAGRYRSIDNFVEAYQTAILSSLEPFTQDELTSVNLEQIVQSALDDAADFIDVDLAGQIQGGIRTTISDTADFYEELGVPIDDMLAAIETRDEIITLTEEFNNNLGAMREELLDGTIDTMKNQFARGIVDRNKLAEEIFEFTDGRAFWARTNARMVVSSSNRIARDELRESADLKHGFYYGDIRDSTRAFCRACVGKTFNTKQIKDMSNGQGLEVEIYAGGWNCIHSWLWVDPEWDPDIKKSFDSARSISDVEADSLSLKVPNE